MIGVALALWMCYTISSNFMARQATPGIDGTLGFSISILAHVKRQDLASAALTLTEAPVSRTVLKRLARDLLSRGGTEGLRDLWRAAVGPRRKRVLRWVDALFPELCNHDDDSG